MQRTSVDLPDPDRPMMMNISPWRISRSIARAAPPSPASTSSAELALPSRRRMKSWAPEPNSFQTLRQASLTGRESLLLPATTGVSCEAIVMLCLLDNTEELSGPDRRPNGTACPRRTALLGPGLPGRLVLGDPAGRHILRRLAVEIDLAAQRVQHVGVDLVVLRHLVGDRPFVLHALPGIF